MPQKQSVHPQHAKSSVLGQIVTPPVPAAIAYDRAYSESLALNDPYSLQDREQQQLQANIVDEGVQIIAEQFKSGRLEDTGELSNLENFPVEQQAERVLFMLEQMDIETVSPRILGLMTALRSSPGMSLDQFDDAYAQVPSADMAKALAGYRQYKFQELEADYADFRDSHDSKSKWESVGGFTAGELIPFVSVLTRLGVTRTLLEAIDPEFDMGVKGFIVGEARQELRDNLKNSTPSERKQKIRMMISAFEELEKDPANRGWIMRYNVRDMFEQILTPDVITGTSSKNSLDRWFGNIETALGVVFTGWLVARAGKSIKTMGKAGDEVMAKSVADFSGNHEYSGSFLQALADGPVGKKFGIDSVDAVATAAPKPAAFIDDLKVITPGQKIQLQKSEYLKDKIIGDTERLQAFAVNETGKARIVREAVEQMDAADHMEIYPGMSTIARLGDDTGVQITATYGKNAKQGWDDIQEVISELLVLDPRLENFEVLRRTANNGVEKVFANELDFAAVAATKLEDVSFDKLIQLSKGPEDAELTKQAIREAGKRAGTAPPLTDEYFLRQTQDAFWHTIDEHVFEKETFTNTGWFPRILADPKRKWGKDVYEQNLHRELIEHATVRDLQQIAQPFFKLPAKDAERVWEMFEWSEQYAKTNNKAPSLDVMMTTLDGVTPKQVSGLISLREMHDTMWTLLNRKLYREYVTQGYLTARPASAGLPSFHGRALAEDALPKRVTAFDPITKEMRTLEKADLETLYRDGGKILDNDLAVDVGTKQKATQIIIDGSEYRVGKLSTSPMTYHPGYHIRLYKDPYFIVKKTKGVAVNGRVTNEVFEEAIRTSPSKAEAENFINRIRRSNEDPEDVSFDVVRSRDLSVTEATLKQKQTLQQEGRMFWDQRNFDRLPDTTGSLAKVQDPVTSVAAGIGMFSKQIASEDFLRSLKNGWINEFGDLLKGQEITLKTTPMDEIVRKLKGLTINNADPALNKKYNKAIELAEYIRAQHGTNENLLPWMRSKVADLAYGIGRIGKGESKFLNSVSRRTEKLAERMDPIKTLRSVNFNLFMALRPVRQALMQSMQVGFLAPLEPLYVGSGKMFSDSIALRLGLIQMHKATYKDGISVGAKAKTMGLTAKEYRKLVKEVDRSGLLETVDLHSFAGGVRKYNQVPTDAKFRSIRQTASGARDFMQKIGFNFGERNNLTMTYMIALKRAKKKKGVKSLLEFTDEDWKNITTEASNLALGMVRPNNFGYQEGLFSLATQFFSFSHKAALTLLGQNPSIKGMDLFKTLSGTYLLYGANMYGTRDFVEEHLRMMGREDFGNTPIGDSGGTITDLLSAGAIDVITNKLLEDSIDLGFLAPGFDLSRFYEMQLKTLWVSTGEAAVGPFANVFSRNLQALNAVSYAYGAESTALGPTEKALMMANNLLAGTFPLYNDANMARMAAKYGRWVSSGGDQLPLEASTTAMWARGLFGARTREEAVYYNMLQNARMSQEDFNDIVRANQKHFKIYVTGWLDGAITYEAMVDQFRMAYHAVEDLDPALRTLALEQSIVGQIAPGIPSIGRMFADNAAKGLINSQALAQYQEIVELTIEDPAERAAILQMGKDMLQGADDKGQYFVDQEKEL